VRAIPRRYVALDGVRGLAAFVVILLHTASAIAPNDLRPHFGSLAVDIFFVLSGFVLAYSYDRQFARGMKPLAFMRKRFVRLYPLFALGLFCGLALRIVPAIRDAASTGGLMTSHEMVLAVIFNAFMFPTPDGMQNHYIFPANLPAWSLFFEVWVANLVFACFWKRLQGATLGVFIVTMGILGVANEAVFRSWSVGSNWGTLVGGFARVWFSFMFGVAIARLHAARPPRFRIPAWIHWAAVIALMFVPLEHIVGHTYELLCVLFLFPALVYFGAEAANPHPAIGSALGEASYPAYTIHIPMLSLVCYLAPGAIAHPSELYGIGFALAVLCVSLPLAYFYDKPVRAALERRFRPAAGPMAASATPGTP
jgi:peptidoglycan/LPS O-acetylase OafA/YrhL